MPFPDVAVVVELVLSVLDVTVVPVVLVVTEELFPVQDIITGTAINRTIKITIILLFVLVRSVKYFKLPPVNVSLNQAILSISGVIRKISLVCHADTLQPKLVQTVLVESINLL